MREREVSLFLSECDPALGEVVWRHFHHDDISGQNADEVQPHLAADMGKNHVAVFKFDSEHCVREQFSHGTFDCQYIFGQVKTSGSFSVTRIICSK